MWQELHARILDQVREYYQARHKPGAFLPGQSKVPYAGRVFDAEEIVAAVDATLEFWLTLGPQGEAFEHELSQYVGVRHSLVVNSGSSANLIAFSALTSPKLDRPLQPGDEVLTVAAGFPTTVAPIVQNGCIPVFVDVRTDTANVMVERLYDAISPKTRAVMIAHTLGNPFDLDGVLDLVKTHDLYLVEDNCDALGATYRRQKDRNLWPFRHAELLSAPPSHDGRRRRRPHRQRPAEADRRVVPRLGPRLLVPVWQR